MAFAPVVVSLPVADRRSAHDFYRAALDLEAFGEPASDGLPEPLQFAVNDGLHLMLVPVSGFDRILLGGRWVIGDHAVAVRGQVECILGLSPESRAAVDALIARAREAGGAVVAEPAERPWGYVAMFADPDGHVWMLTAT